MDGVEQLNNILVIGMTNRKDMIDEALLRPGRLEVHVEISESLPTTVVVIPFVFYKHQITEPSTIRIRP